MQYCLWSYLVWKFKKGRIEESATWYGKKVDLKVGKVVLTLCGLAFIFFNRLFHLNLLFLENGRLKSFWTFIAPPYSKEKINAKQNIAWLPFHDIFNLPYGHKGLKAVTLRLHHINIYNKVCSLWQNVYLQKPWQHDHQEDRFFLQSFLLAV